MTYRVRCFAMGLFVLTAVSSAGAAAGDYSDGLQAYLDGDFNKARGYWLKGAKAEDAKSMFNLGLLHEREQIDGANQAKAESWFRLAGKNGYPAADYHLALILETKKAKASEAQALLTRSSQNGYFPAKRRLSDVGELPDGQPVSSVAGVSTKNARSSNVQTGSPTKDNSSYQTESWLKRRHAESWTIQILAFNDERKVQTFIDEHGLQRQASYYIENANGEALYKLVYGVYDSKDKADFARQNLSTDLKQHGPWLRTMASVQDAIRAQ